MKKIIVATTFIVLLCIAVYFSGAYTYFQERQVAETLPPVTSSEADAPETPAEPRVIKSGNFRDADFLHTGEGTAKILEYPDGTHVLSFQEFSVVNGPDVYVYLTESSSPTSDEESLGDYIDLGPLKGNIGDQHYILPQGAEQYTSVALWCKQFGVLFPYAVMTTPSL